MRGQDAAALRQEDRDPVAGLHATPAQPVRQPVGRFAQGTETDRRDPPVARDLDDRRAIGVQHRPSVADLGRDVVTGRDLPAEGAAQRLVVAKVGKVQGYGPGEGAKIGRECGVVTVSEREAASPSVRGHGRLRGEERPGCPAERGRSMQDAAAFLAIMAVPLIVVIAMVRRAARSGEASTSDDGGGGWFSGDSDGGGDGGGGGD
jgi:hypothetical protein